MARIVLVLILFAVAVVAMCVTVAVGDESDRESMQTAETFGYIKRKLFGGAKSPSKKSSSSSSSPSSSLWGGYPLTNGYYSDGYGYGWY